MSKLKETIVFTEICKGSFRKRREDMGRLHGYPRDLRHLGRDRNEASSYQPSKNVPNTETTNE